VTDHLHKAHSLQVLSSRDLGIGRLRLVPKLGGLRPIVNLGSPSIAIFHPPRIPMSSIAAQIPLQRQGSGQPQVQITVLDEGQGQQQGLQDQRLQAQQGQKDLGQPAQPGRKRTLGGGDWPSAGLPPLPVGNLPAAAAAAAAQGGTSHGTGGTSSKAGLPPRAPKGRASSGKGSLKAGPVVLSFKGINTILSNVYQVLKAEAGARPDVLQVGVTRHTPPC
jgi:hypothetical protein